MAQEQFLSDIKNSIKGIKETKVLGKHDFYFSKFSLNIQNLASNIKIHEGYTISGNGKGGAAGFAKGSANIKLEEKDDLTVLKYSVEAQIGGKLAQLGSRLIDSTSKKLAGKFFDNFVKIVDGTTKIEEEIK